VNRPREISVIKNDLAVVMDRLDRNFATTSLQTRGGLFRATQAIEATEDLPRVRRTTAIEDIIIMAINDDRSHRDDNRIDGAVHRIDDRSRADHDWVMVMVVVVMLVIVVWMNHFGAGLSSVWHGQQGDGTKS
jgi:hypothetical protein